MRGKEKVKEGERKVKERDSMEGRKRLVSKSITGQSVIVAHRSLSP